MQVCEVLADPIRVQIVEMLAKRDLTAGQISQRFDVTRPAISRHLRVLREAGLATMTPDAQRRVYRLNPQPLRDLDRWLSNQRKFWEARLDVLGEHLDEMERQETEMAKPKRRDRR